MHSIAKFLGQAALIAASAVTTLSAWAAVPVMPSGNTPGTTASPGPVQASSSVTLRWNAVSNTTYYSVGVRDLATNALVVSATTNSPSYVASLNAGKPYRWNVAACNASGCSSYTTVLYFQTAAPPAYGLTVSKAGTGTGTVSSSGLSCSGNTCSGTYSSGTTVTLTAAATSTSTFDGWSGCTSVSGASCIVNMTAAKSVTATFNILPVNYTIAANASPAAGGSISGAGNFVAGSTRTVTATANSGYTFANWTENGSAVSTSASYTITLNANHTLIANFAVVASQKASLTTPKSASTLPGSKVTFSWNSGSGVTQYLLYVGSTAGSSDIYTQLPTSNRTVTIDGLPTYGKTIYVRLGSHLANGWQYSDYTFKAMARGIDYGWPISASNASCLQQLGNTTVFRYYSSATSTKNLTANEAASLHRSGLKIATVYETCAGSPISSCSRPGISYFTANQGVDDANQAIDRAHAAGQPEGTVIFFAVDYLPNTNDIKGGISEYFDAIVKTMAKKFTVGVYGSGNIIEYAHSYWPNVKRFWQTRLYDGLPVLSYATVYQYTKDSKKPTCGNVSVDDNEIFDDVGW